MKYYICKIKPEGTFHIGGKGLGSEKSEVTIHSDSLFSGILNKYFELYSENTIDFCKEKKFILSSAFLYCGEILFVPKPRLKPNLFEENDIGISKKLRKIEFLSEEMFLKYAGIKEKIKITDNVIFDKRFLMTKKEKQQFDDRFKNVSDAQKFIYKLIETPRNVLDRKTMRSEIYYVGETVINVKHNCGCYFLVHLIDESFKSELESSIKLLGEDGIGGDRSSGKGQFQLISFNEYNGKLNLTKPTEKFITLSMYLPTEAEIKAGLLNSDNVSYELVKRRGWIYSPSSKSARKRTIRMFAEGSCFKNINGSYGKVVNAAPEGFPHPVYKSGLAFKVYI